MAPKSDKKGFKKPKNRSNKIHLVFDEEKRREFLTGFHKRKLQRKKKAQEDLEKELKEERKRLKAEAKESYKKLVVSNRDIPELDELLKDEYEDEDVKVKVVELNVNDRFIGANKPQKEESEVEDEVESDKEEIPGMELKHVVVKKPKKEPLQTFKSEKDIKKVLKKQATRNVKHSKVFQRKNKINQQKQKKKSLQQKKERIKFRSKH